MQSLKGTGYGLDFEVKEMTLLFCFFTEALQVHENEEIWAGVRRVPVPTLDLPMAVVTLVSAVFDWG